MAAKKPDLGILTLPDHRNRTQAEIDAGVVPVDENIIDGTEFNQLINASKDLQTVSVDHADLIDLINQALSNLQSAVDNLNVGAGDVTQQNLTDAIDALESGIRGTGAASETLTQIRADINVISAALQLDDGDLETLLQRTQQLIADVGSLEIADISGLQAALNTLTTSKEAQGVAANLVDDLKDGSTETIASLKALIDSIDAVDSLTSQQVVDLIAAQTDAHLLTDAEKAAIAASASLSAVTSLVNDLESTIRGTASVSETLGTLRSDVNALSEILSADDADLDTAQERIDRIKQLISDVDGIGIVDVQGLQGVLDTKEAAGTAQTLVGALQAEVDALETNLQSDDPNYTTAQQRIDQIKQLTDDALARDATLTQMQADVALLQEQVANRATFELAEPYLNGGGTHNHIVYSPDGNYLVACADVGGLRYQMAGDVRWRYLATSGTNAGRQIASAAVTNDGIVYLLVGNGPTFGQLQRIDIKTGTVTVLVSGLDIRANMLAEGDTGSRPRGSAGWLISIDEVNQLVRYGAHDGLHQYDIEAGADSVIALQGEPVLAIGHYNHAVLNDPAELYVGTRTQNAVRVSNLSGPVTVTSLLTVSRVQDLVLVGDAGAFLAACHLEGVRYWDGSTETNVTPPQHSDPGSNGSPARWTAAAVVSIAGVMQAAVANINPDSATEWVFRTPNIQASPVVWEDATPTPAQVNIGSVFNTPVNRLLGNENDTGDDLAGTFAMTFNPSDSTGNKLLTTGTLSLFCSQNFAGPANEIGFQTYNNGLSMVTVTSAHYDGSNLLLAAADHNAFTLPGSQLFTGEPTRLPFTGLSGGAAIASLGEGANKVTVFLPMKDTDPYSSANDVVFHRGAGPVTEWSTTGFNTNLNGAGDLAAGEVPRAAGELFFDNGDATYTLVVWADGVGFVRSTFTLSTSTWSAWTEQSSGPVADLTGGNHNQRRPGAHSADGSVLFAMQYKQAGIWRSTNNKGASWVNILTQIEASDAARTGRLCYIESQDVLIVSNADSLWRVNAASTSSATATQITGINSGCQFDIDSRGHAFVHVRSTGHLLRFEDIGAADSIDDAEQIADPEYHQRIPDLANGMYIFSYNGVEYGITYYQGGGFVIWTVPAVGISLVDDGFEPIRNDTTIVQSGASRKIYPAGTTYYGPAPEGETDPVLSRRVQISSVTGDTRSILIAVDNVEVQGIPAYLTGPLRDAKTGEVDSFYLSADDGVVRLIPNSTDQLWDIHVMGRDGLDGQDGYEPQVLLYDYLYDNPTDKNLNPAILLDIGAIVAGQRIKCDSFYPSTVYPDGHPHGGNTYIYRDVAASGVLSDGQFAATASTHFEGVFPEHKIYSTQFGHYNSSSVQSDEIQASFDCAATVRDALIAQGLSRMIPWAIIDIDCLISNLHLTHKINIKTFAIYGNADIRQPNGTVGYTDLTKPILKIGSDGLNGSGVTIDIESIEHKNGWNNLLYGFPWEHEEESIALDILNQTRLKMLRVGFIRYANIGLRVRGQDVNGSSGAFGYNKNVFIQQIASCRRLFQIESSAVNSAWVNENLIKIASMNAPSPYIPYGSSYGIVMNSDGSNKNTFEHPSFELGKSNVFYTWSSGATVRERHHYAHLGNEYKVVGGGDGQVCGTNPPTHLDKVNDFTDNAGVVWKYMGNMRRMPLLIKKGNVENLSIIDARWETGYGPFAELHPEIDQLPRNSKFTVYLKQSVEDAPNQKSDVDFYDSKVAGQENQGRVYISLTQDNQIAGDYVKTNTVLGKAVGSASGWYVPGYFDFDAGSSGIAEYLPASPMKISRYGVNIGNTFSHSLGVKIDTSETKSFLIKKIDGHLGKLYFQCFDENDVLIPFNDAAPEAYAKMQYLASVNAMYSPDGTTGESNINVSENVKSIVVAATSYINDWFNGIHIKPVRQHIKKYPELTFMRPTGMSSHDEGRYSLGVPTQGYFPVKSERIYDINQPANGWFVATSGYLALPWVSGGSGVYKGGLFENAGNIYEVLSAGGGTLGTTAPTHTSGIVNDGSKDLLYVGPTAVLTAI